MRNNDLGNIFAMTEMFSRCSRTEEVQELTVDIVRKFGVEFVFAGLMPRKNLTPSEQMSHVLFGKWPSEWSDRYFRNMYLERDPTIAHTRNTDKLLKWNELGTQNFRVMNEAREFKLNQGVTVPMISIDGAKLGVSFAGTNVSHSPEATITFQVVGALATAKALELIKCTGLQEAIPLTPAECACLEWVTEGKTNWEIGMILGISDKTVEKHLCNCMRKTNSINRTQLVANALRQGIIH